MSRANAAFTGIAPTAHDIMNIRTWLLDNNVFTVKQGTTILGMNKYYNDHGYTTSFIKYSSKPDISALKAQIDLHAGLHPSIVELSLAGNFPYNEKKVFYHYVLIVGIVDENTYLIVNGDDIAGEKATARTVKWQDFINAGICGLLVIIASPNKIAIPSKWHDNNTVLTAPNGITVKYGFRDFILSHLYWDSTNYPVAEETKVPAFLQSTYPEHTTMQVFYNYVLMWGEKTGVVAYVSGALLNIIVRVASNMHEQNTSNAEIVTAAMQFLHAAESAMRQPV